MATLPPDWWLLVLASGMSLWKHTWNALSKVAPSAFQVWFGHRIDSSIMKIAMFNTSKPSHYELINSSFVQTVKPWLKVSEWQRNLISQQDLLCLKPALSFLNLLQQNGVPCRTWFPSSWISYKKAWFYLAFMTVEVLSPKATFPWTPIAKVES